MSVLELFGVVFLILLAYGASWLVVEMINSSQRWPYPLLAFMHKIDRVITSVLIIVIYTIWYCNR